MFLLCHLEWSSHIVFRSSEVVHIFHSSYPIYSNINVETQNQLLQTVGLPVSCQYVSIISREPTLFFCTRGGVCLWLSLLKESNSRCLKITDASLLWTLQLVLKYIEISNYLVVYGFNTHCGRHYRYIHTWLKMGSFI